MEKGIQRFSFRVDNWIRVDFLFYPTSIIIIIPINNKSMTKETGLLIGSAIFLFLGIVAGAVFHIYVGMKSNPDVKGANQRYTIINNVEWVVCRFWLRRSVCGLCGLVLICIRWILWFSLYLLLKKNDFVYGYFISFLDLDSSVYHIMTR